MVVGGDQQFYTTNPTSIGSGVQRIHAVYIFDPYAATPKQAWSRVAVASTSGYRHGTGMVLNADGTVSFRDLSSSNSRFTLNIGRKSVAAGAPSPTPMSDQFQAWRAATRDPVTGRTFELHQTPIGPYAENPTALYETTSGGFVRVATLPSSWLPSADNDNHSRIEIVNGRAYVSNQVTGTGTNGTIQLAVHQVNLSTGAVQSFTSPTMTIPELAYSKSINGLHGRFAFVPQAGCFVMFPSARTNAWVFRPPASWAV
jgi:hypothetical protein